MTFNLGNATAAACGGANRALIPEIQAAAYTLLCGTVDSIESYSRRACRLIDYYCGAPVEADLAFGRVSYRQALSHAVATDVTAAVLQSLAYIALQYVATGKALGNVRSAAGLN